MIKFEHSIFALPFALTGALLAVRGQGLSAAVLAGKFFWIIVAMVAARSAAMVNRVVDADDAKNPRPACGHSGRADLMLIHLGIHRFWSAVFVAAAAMLNPLCLALSPVALIVVCGYSYAKRFTAFAHLILGLALGIAPLAAWIAIRGSFEWPITLLTAAVMLWVGGFDIIYACQDLEFDRREGLVSIPAALARRVLDAVAADARAMTGLLLWLVASGWADRLGGGADGGIARLGTCWCRLTISRRSMRVLQVNGTWAAVLCVLRYGSAGFLNGR
jgi:4-hydroxybenzoate polyprenyltransferase